MRRVSGHAGRFMAVGAIAIAATGCAQVLDSALDTAAQRTGEAIGERIGAAAIARLPGTWTPPVTSMYVNYMFAAAFPSYMPGERDYDPGDWTRWGIEDPDTGEAVASMERAFLARTDEGNEWWRVRYVSLEEDEQIVLEGLFRAETREVLRLRGEFPNEDGPRELPVEDGTYQVADPVVLTQESLDAAEVGPDRVQVPAGEFDARHYRFGDLGDDAWEWWTVEGIPGGVVQFRTSSGYSDGDLDVDGTWMRLEAFGSDATTELGSF